MAWLALFVVVAFIGVIGVVVNVGRLRFERRTARELRALVAVPRSSLPRPGVVELPPPVARYRELAVGDRAPAQTLRLCHWRTISGLRVPFEAEVTWQLASGPFTYAHWLIESMEYDEEQPATACGGAPEADSGRAPARLGAAL